MSTIYPIPSGFINYLCANEPRLLELTPEQQNGVARIIMMAPEKRHRHKKYPEHFSIHCRDVQALLGRHYKNIIDGLGLLTPMGPWSIEAHETRPYDLSPRWASYHENYWAQAVESNDACVLVDAKNKPVPQRKNGNAIRSKSATSSDAKSKAKMPFAVPVNLPNLREAITYLNDPVANDNQFKGLLTETPERDRKRLNHIRLHLMQIYVMARNTLLQTGMLPQEYVEVQSGRLCGIGLHLQNVCREVKIIALAGLGHEYDFANCHFSIFNQLAKRAGCACPTIGDYLANKKETRQQLARDIGITVAQAKDCLLMMLNGGIANSADSAMLNEIGADKTKSLSRHPYYKAILKDIRSGTATILDKARQDCKRVYNAMGKGISRHKKRGTLLAHILQGQEAQMLNIVLRHCGQDMLLLQHDGFTCRTEVDINFLEAEILRETGLVMQLEKVSHDMT